MSKKLTFRGHSTQTYAEVFQSFISAKTAKGVADITIRNYHNNLHNTSKFLDIDMPFADLTKRHLDEMIVEMRRAGLAHNSITTYGKPGNLQNDNRISRCGCLLNAPAHTARRSDWRTMRLIPFLWS